MLAPVKISRSKIVISAVACAVAIIIVWAIEGQIDKIKATVDQLTLNAKSIESLQLQKDCSEQALKAYQSSGALDLDPSRMSTDYTNHYNSRLNKCLMAVSTDDFTRLASQNKMEESIDIQDAFEGNALGAYVGSYLASLHKLTVVSCWMTLPNGSRAACKSKAEWQSLAKIYME